MPRDLDWYKAQGVAYPPDLDAPPRLRGELNNNPTNLDWAGIPWKGLDPAATRAAGERFGVYVDTKDDAGGMVEGAVWGLRAAIVNMRTHERRAGGRIRLDRLIAIWAPPSENHTANYVARVARETGTAPDQAVDLRERGRLGALLVAVIRVECGRCIYPARVIDAAIDLADGVYAPKRARAGTGNPQGGAAVPSRTEQAARIATGATAATAAAAAVEAAREALPQIQQAAAYAGWLKWAAIGLALAALGFALHRLVQDKNPESV